MELLCELLGTEEKKSYADIAKNIAEPLAKTEKMVIIDNGSITLLSTGENYNEGADDKKSRAVSALSYTQNGGNVLAKSYDKAIAAATVISLSKGILNAFSASDYALGVAATQTGGWVLTKDGKE